MVWGRFDDQYDISRKVAGLTDGAFRMDVSAVLWCNRNLTNGHIGAHDLRNIRAQFRTPRRLADELVAAQRWHRLPMQEPCASEFCQKALTYLGNAPDGWLIHDFLDQNKSRERVLSERADATERQRKARDAAAAKRAAEEAESAGNVTPLSQRDAVGMSRRDFGRSHNEVRAMSQAPRPDPTHAPSTCSSGVASPTGPYRARARFWSVALTPGLAL